MLILAVRRYSACFRTGRESLFPQSQDPAVVGGANHRAGWYRAASVPEERQGSPALAQGEDAHDIHSGPR